MIENEYWNKKKACAYLGISIATLDRYTKSGDLAVYRFGGIIRYTKEDLDAFLRRGEASQ